LSVYIYSGGTEVTVTGNNLDSVAEPRINLTVVITSNVTSSTNSSLEVVLLIIKFNNITAYS